MIRQQPISTLFPYTTLFRSLRSQTRRGLLSVLQPSEGEKTAQRGRVEVKTGLRGAEEDGWRPQNPYRQPGAQDRKSTRLNSSHVRISYAVFCLKKKIKENKH